MFFVHICGAGRGFKDSTFITIYLLKLNSNLTQFNKTKGFVYFLWDKSGGRWLKPGISLQSDQRQAQQHSKTR
ncbi:hypothetical protein F4826_003143 [Rahnella inusitata]|nr:hypothetical protein [Rahnella inusitata]